MGLFSTGGGELNGVDGAFSDYEWTGEFYIKDGNGQVRQRDPKKRAPLYFNLHVVKDGSSGPVIRSIYAGAIDEWNISDDGKTLEPTLGPDQMLWGGTEFATLITSAVEKGIISASELPDPETHPGVPINFEFLMGRRARFGYVPILDRNTGEVKTHVAKKGKNKGKTFKDTTPVVLAALGGESVARSSVAAGSKPNGKAVPAWVEVDDEAVAQLASRTLVKLVARAKDQKLKFNEVTLEATKALKGNDLKAEVVEYLSEVENIQAIEGVIINLGSKSRDITLVDSFLD